MLASTADSAQFWRIGQNWPCYLARPSHALFARISCNTVLESLKHTDQSWVGSVSGAWNLTKHGLSLLFLRKGLFQTIGTSFIKIRLVWTCLVVMKMMKKGRWRGQEEAIEESAWFDRVWRKSSSWRSEMPTVEQKNFSIKSNPDVWAAACIHGHYT